MNTTPRPSSKIPSLDGIRAISVLIVVISHAGYGHIVPGGFGVTVFFFLSGFLITTLMLREVERYGTIDLKMFYARRALRLAPPLFATLAAAILLVRIGMVEGDLSYKALLSQVFFYFNYYSLYGPAETSVDGLEVLWSLSVEEHFYLIWPVMFILMIRRGIPGWTLLPVAIAILGWRVFRDVVMGSSFNEIYISTDTRFDSLIYGCLLAFLIARGGMERILPQSAGGAVLAVAASLMVLVSTFVLRDDFFRSTFRYTLQGLALIPLFYYAVQRPDTLLFRPLNWWGLRWIGLWSYTIYLSHFVIIKALQPLEPFAQSKPLLLVVAFALSCLWSALVYALLERPTHPMRRRLIGHGTSIRTHV